MHLNKKGLNIKDYQFDFEDLEICVEAGDKCKVPFDSFLKKEIPIKMIKI